ncbi:hypothetical protein [uncultured Cardiobacterium sp.]|nr:hypothetical protein [uncultured Cardiobacterium sp.]
MSTDPNPFDYLHGLYRARGESVGILWIDPTPTSPFRQTATPTPMP